MTNQSLIAVTEEVKPSKCTKLMSYKTNYVSSSINFIILAINKKEILNTEPYEEEIVVTHISTAEGC